MADFGDGGIENLQVSQLTGRFYASSAMPDHTKLLLLCLLLLISSSSCFGSEETDIPCLRALQQSLGDPNGVLKSSWNFEPNNITTGYICQFTGVECWHPDENRVLSLHLGNLGLQGQFPQGLNLCNSMIGLDLSSNNLAGPIPADISQQVPFLTSLDLSFNSFSGEIPASISNITYLNVLNLQHNKLSGQIPEEINNLARLSSMNVADNLLSGPIPNSPSLKSNPASNFAGNPGMCGATLDACRIRRRIWIRFRPHRINDESSIGAAVGFVVGFVVAFYFPSCFISCRKFQAYVFPMWL